MVEQEADSEFEITPLVAHISDVLATDAAGDPRRLPESLVEEAVEELLELHPEGILPIVQVGNPVLRAKALPVGEDFSQELLERFVEALYQTTVAAPGVGLASPQVGIPLRVAVLYDEWHIPADIARERERKPLPLTPIINASYQPVGEETVDFFEGCLSVQGFQAVVRRHRTIALTAEDLSRVSVTKEYSGWQARIAQHETDHLDGILYTDLMLPRSLTTNEDYDLYWADLTPEEAALVLRF